MKIQWNRFITIGADICLYSISCLDRTLALWLHHLGIEAHSGLAEMKGT